MLNYIPLNQRRQATQSTPSDAISGIMDRIRSVESSGNYQARGPVVETGQYAGEQAMGAYQLMPGNLPDWSREALGREVTPEEFLSNPELQDTIVRDRMQKIYDQYGNADDVASVWFSGRPVSKAGNAQDVTGTSVPEYIQRFRDAGGSSTKMAYIPLSQRQYNL